MAAPSPFRVPSRAVLVSPVLVPAVLMLALACSKNEQDVIEVTVDPVMVEVAPGDSVRLQATVKGTSDTRLSWEVTSGEGTVDGEGLYTAPPQEGKAQVRATSVVDSLAFSLRINVGKWLYDMPVSQSSATYLNGQTSDLGKYRTYTWMLELSDGKGNSSRAWDRFYVGL
ncbi:MAG: hypothetical protein ACJ8AT_07100 [Hyalangium sp.]|uniref:hypothetical protein n=1 Tax=Hyalangium sp. TaxID=2028555 RepID=UPI00389A41F2